MDGELGEIIFWSSKELKVFLDAWLDSFRVRAPVDRAAIVIGAAAMFAYEVGSDLKTSLGKELMHSENIDHATRILTVTMNALKELEEAKRT